MELLNDQDTYMELVDREVIGKQKELLVDTVRGVPGAKIEYMVMDRTSHRAGSGRCHLQ